MRPTFAPEAGILSPYREEGCDDGVSGGWTYVSGGADAASGCGPLVGCRSEAAAMCRRGYPMAPRDSLLTCISTTSAYIFVSLGIFYSIELMG